MVKFIHNIVYYLIVDVMSSNNIKSGALLVGLNKTDKYFALKLYTYSDIFIYFKNINIFFLI